MIYFAHCICVKTSKDRPHLPLGNRKQPVNHNLGYFPEAVLSGGEQNRPQNRSILKIRSKRKHGYQLSTCDIICLYKQNRARFAMLPLKYGSCEIAAFHFSSFARCALFSFFARILRSSSNISRTISSSAASMNSSSSGSLPTDSSNTAASRWISAATSGMRMSGTHIVLDRSILSSTTNFSRSGSLSMTPSSTSTSRWISAATSGIRMSSPQIFMGRILLLSQTNFFFWAAAGFFDMAVLRVRFALFSQGLQMPIGCSGISGSQHSSFFKTVNTCRSVSRCDCGSRLFGYASGCRGSTPEAPSYSSSFVRRYGAAVKTIRPCGKVGHRRRLDQGCSGPHFSQLLRGPRRCPPSGSRSPIRCRTMRTPAPAARPPCGSAPMRRLPSAGRGCDRWTPWAHC